MATDLLIERLLRTPDRPASEAIDALRQLLDDATDEPASAPRGISEAATLVGLTAHALRYYDQLGLVRPARSAAGYREYSARNLRRLVFITRMRVSGMTMADLTTYIGLVEQGESTVAQRRQIMLDQQARIEQQLRELTLALEATRYKIRTYGGAPHD